MTALDEPVPRLQPGNLRPPGLCGTSLPAVTL